MPSDQLRDRLQTTLGAAYSLDRELGFGGMSRVFLAREAALERVLAVPFYVSGAWLRIDPTYTPLRGDPRFGRLTAGG